MASVAGTSVVTCESLVSTWAETLTFEWPTPSSGTSWLSILLSNDDSRPAAWSAPPPAVMPTPGAASTLPLLSTTVTSPGASLGMLDATRCTTAVTWPLVSCWPVAMVTSTEACGLVSSVMTKSLWAGSASVTWAAETPVMEPMVASSSPCSARW